MAGTGGLGGLNVPLDSPTPSPTLPPFPAPQVLSWNGSPSQVPQYPPYIPEQDMNTSSGMPSSTLDGIHDDGGVILQKPGELGPPPYPMGPQYSESPPGLGRPAGRSGEGAEEADASDAALRRTREALNQADQAQAQAITEAHTADASPRRNFSGSNRRSRPVLRPCSQAWVRELGEEQLPELLDRKASQAKQVASNAQAMSARLAMTFQAVGNRFEEA
ncbi:ABC transporter substrate-binding protein [Candidatus Mycolicibacterium alkanivorans]|uniref:ABC transporter substrate-binding protein n=1 Tax=Candidatus Mycolicibacterium alkanivorans TaxID=2954114 RepID=A0ABS9YXH8_9MYCO|nr:ABC transporter substrate-binding protein [Candidatus Mycolicibacterium alkanivorans]MCI4675951.1 ABC transporter substrate-binding protein [Candidatus Mycolicibacterium alkanivorans]